MTLSKIILFVTLIIYGGYSHADNDSQKEAEILLDSMNIDKMLEQTISQMLDIELKNNPTIAPYREVMLAFLNKYMSYESLKPEFIAIYAETFTSTELREITAFYKTPTGAKTLEKMPELTVRGSEIGSKRVQDNIQELQEMIKQESERIIKLQGN